MRKLFLLFIFSLLLVLGGCSGEVTSEPTLREAGRILENEPDSIQYVIRMLESLDTATLSKGDRSLHTLLSVKAADKNFIPHSAPSSILKVVDYEKTHQSRGLYPEALYYAGRVYTDLGDYPTALEFFQAALTEIDKGRPNLRLKGHILSQTGGLYQDLSLYSESAIYLREVIKIDESLKDTTNLFLDNKLLGAGFIHTGKLDSAAFHIRKAYSLSKNLPTPHTEFMKLYIAMIKHKQGQTDSALALLEGVPDKVWPDSRPWALITAADIYLAADRPDSAYKLASKVLNFSGNVNPAYKRRAYSIILLPEIRHLLPADSLYPMTVKYLEAAREELDMRDEKSISRQRDTYNYALHLNKLRESESLNNIYLIACLALITVILGLLSVLLFIRNRKNKKIIQLHETNEMLDKKLEEINQTAGAPLINIHNHNSDKEKRLLVDINERIKAILKDGQSTVDNYILQSQVYDTLRSHVDKEKPINDNDIFWEELEKTVLTTSPLFLENLRLITGGITKKEKRLALLLKCGLRPTEAALIFSLTRQGVNGRKDSLKRKIEANHIKVDSIEALLKRL
ncbi:MAG: tetratricopeptide repeat protein [Muribaculaceae bacterium]|nr:tetratricopeptide repeat protein [Muribaculaceae bacterium]MDE7109450.1 tetratricopeptide repeat protein [Muribaculaceae bacterium]